MDVIVQTEPTSNVYFQFQSEIKAVYYDFKISTFLYQLVYGIDILKSLVYRLWFALRLGINIASRLSLDDYIHVDLF